MAQSMAVCSQESVVMANAFMDVFSVFEALLLASMGPLSLL